MGLTDRLAAKVATAAKATADRAIDTFNSGADTVTRLRAIQKLDDSQSMTVEMLLLMLVEIIRGETSQRRPASRDAVADAARTRQRVAGAATLAGGGIGGYVVSLYCEAAVLCDVIDWHQLDASPQQAAGHLLVLWNVVPDHATALAAMDGSGASVASYLSSHARAAVGTDKNAREMNKKDVLLLLWRLRGVATGASVPDKARRRDVLLPAGRVDQIIKATELQLGLVEPQARGAGLFARGMGSLDRLKERRGDPAVPQQTGGVPIADVPPPADAPVSRSAQLVEWSAGLFREAGIAADPARAEGVARTAAVALYVTCVLAFADARPLPELRRYCEALPGDLPDRLDQFDDICATWIRLASELDSGTIDDRDPQYIRLRARHTAMIDDGIDGWLAQNRAEFIRGIRDEHG